VAQFGEIANSVGSVSTGNWTFNGVSITRALHSESRRTIESEAWGASHVGHDATTLITFMPSKGFSIPNLPRVQERNPLKISARQIVYRNVASG
jgi:hypothetical protein